MFYVAGTCTLLREKKPSSGIETLCVALNTKSGIYTLS